jgi:hypothetical protein
VYLSLVKGLCVSLLLACYCLATEPSVVSPVLSAHFGSKVNLLSEIAFQMKIFKNI